MRWLLLCVPISLVMALLHMSPLWLFVASGLAIVPLAGLLSEATEEFARSRGPAIGGLLNATFGNATELIICIVALQRNELDIVKASLIGSILGNILLVLGLAILLGGIKYKIQKFNMDVAQSHATMLALAVVALLVPALFVRSIPGISELPNNIQIVRLSIGVAIVEILIYVGSLLFALYTHEQLFQNGGLEETAPVRWSERKSALILLLASIAIAGESELLVGGIEPVVAQWHLSKNICRHHCRAHHRQCSRTQHRSNHGIAR